MSESGIWNRAIRKHHVTDVAVIGAGAAGIAAAVSAAEAGARTTLIERYPVLGGTTITSAVHHFQIGPDVHGAPIVRGHYANVMRELHRHGVLNGRSFRGELLKSIYISMLERAGVRIMLHTLFTDVQVTDQHIERIAVETVSGLETIEAAVVIDASADGDVGFAAGAEFEIGRPGDHGLQPMTLYLTLSGLNVPVVRDLDPVDFYPLFVEKLPHIHTSQVRLTYGPGFGVSDDGRMSFSVMHIRDHNPLDSDELTAAEIQARRNAVDIWNFFRTCVPGCENAMLDSTPLQLGVRETRRILGDYILTREDILGCARFEDTIGRSNSFIDVHNPDGEGTLCEYVPIDNWYDIPHRVLTTRNLSNLYTVGRCMSCTHHALGSLREQPTCMVTGQGAGVGAAIAVRAGSEIRQISVPELQAELMRQGADLGPQFNQSFPAMPWFSRETGPKYGQPNPAYQPEAMLNLVGGGS